jgi:type VI secretion system protein ImpC
MRRLHISLTMNPRATEAGHHMNQQTAAAQGAAFDDTQTEVSSSLLDDIVEKSKVAKSDSEHARAKDLIGELVNQVLDGTVVVSNNLSATIDARVAELDRLISDQLSAVMHAPEFQRLEGTWRGLDYLVKESNTGQTIKIKALHAPKRDVVRDFKNAVEFDQSALFKKVYEEESRVSPKTCTSSNRCRMSPRPLTRRSSLRLRRN